MYTPFNCGDWLAAAEVGGDRPQKAYVLGLINGLGWGHRTSFWNSGPYPVTPEQAFLELENRCRSEPMRPLEEHTAMIVIEHLGVEAFQ